MALRIVDQRSRSNMLTFL